MAQPSDGASERDCVLGALSLVTEMAPSLHASHRAPATTLATLSAYRRLTGARRHAALMAADNHVRPLGWGRGLTSG